MISKPTDHIKKEFGNIDVYVFDQLLKGRIHKGQRILDVGCGGGRNIEYMIRRGFDVEGVDQSENAIAKVQSLAKSAAPSSDLSRFVQGEADHLPFPDSQFDVILSIAVLHFAQNKIQFEKMVLEMIRVLKPGGFFIARLASSVGIEDEVKHLGNGVYVLPDGSTRFLVNDAVLLDLTKGLSGTLLDPIKTTVIQGMRSMTTWVVQKSI